MAYTVSGKTSYTDTGNQIRNCEDLIELISPKDVPLLKVLVGMNELAGKPAKLDTIGEEIFNTKFEWFEDQLDADSDTLGSTVTDTDGTSWTATDGSKFRAGHVVKVDSEIVWISAVSTNTLTVVRAQGGTTGATHTNASTLDIIGVSMLENADAPSDRQNALSVPYNYTQEFEDPILVSYTEEAVKKYGMSSTYQYKLGKKYMNLCKLLEKACWHGKRAVGSATAARLMGGFDTFITDNLTNLSSAALTEKDINDLLAAIYADVGLANVPEDLFVPSWLKRKISSFYAANKQSERKERAGGVVVDVIDTDFGTVNVHLGLYVPAGRVYAINLDNVGISPLRGQGFQEEQLAKSGTYMKGHIWGQYTLMVKNDKSHGFIYGASSTT